jgi:hypothetical protein
MRLWLVLAAFAGGGCRYLLDDPAASPDALAPGDGDALCGFGAGLISVDGFCLRDAPEPVVRLEGGTLDTEIDARCLALDTGGDYCVVAGGAVTIAGLKVVGARPLIVVALTTLDVLGPLDVSSDLDATRPAPGAGRGCEPEVEGALFTGGVGGSFGTAGGRGGTATGTPVRPSPVFAIAAPDELRGGCAGVTHALSGSGGGGGVYLVSRARLRVTNTIDASGAPGRGGVPNGGEPTGGGGGGSGGMIVLDAQPLELASTARVIAHGGGGGEGAGGQEPGVAGNESRGGTLGAARGGDGGDGASQLSPATNGTSDQTSGGGGGGGFGVIWMRGGGVGDAFVSPPPLVL